MPKEVIESEAKKPVQLRLYDLLAEARKKEVFDYFFSRGDGDLTVEELLQFSDISSGYLHNLIGIIKDILKDVPQEKLPGAKAYFYRWSGIDLLTQEETLMCRKYLSSLPTNEEIMALARRHIEPLGLTEAEGYTIELGQPKMLSRGMDLRWSMAHKRWAEAEGITVDELYEKIKSIGLHKDEFDALISHYGFNEYFYGTNVPRGYEIECRISRKDGEQTAVFTSSIIIEDEKIEEEEGRYRIEWRAFSDMYDKEYVDAKLSGRNLYYLLACSPDIEKIGKVWRELRWEEIAHVAGMGSRNGGTVGKDALLKALEDPILRLSFRGPEVEELLESARKSTQSCRITH